MNSFREKFIAAILRRPKTCLLVSFLMLAALAPALTLLKEDYSYKVWYSANDPLIQKYDEFEKKFGNDETIILGVYHPESVYNPKTLRLIFALTKDMWNVTDVTRVDSLANYDFLQISQISDDIEIAPLLSKEQLERLDESFIKEMKSKVSGDKLIENLHVSRDGKMAVIRGQIKPSYVKNADNELIVSELREIIKKRSSTPHEFYLSGSVPLMNSLKEISEGDIKLLFPVMLFLFTLFLWLIFKRKTSIVLTYSLIFLSITMMMATAALFGDKINPLSIVAPCILLTVAIADAVHLLTVYFLGLKQGMPGPSALKYSLTKNFYPTLLTTITTAVGFFSFLNAKINPVAMLGIAVGFGVFFAWLNAYLVIGAALQFSPSYNNRGKMGESEMIKPHLFAKNFINWIDSHKKKILALAGLLTLASIYAGKSLEVNLDPFNQFPKDWDLPVSQNKIEKHTGPIKVMEIMIKADSPLNAKSPLFLKKVESFQSWLEAQKYITKTVSLVDILKNINQKLNRNGQEYYRVPSNQEKVAQSLFFYSLGLPPGKDLNDRISIQEDFLRLSVFWDIVNSKEANEKMDLINQKMQEMNINGVITGKMPLFHDLTPYVVSSFLDSFKVAFLLIALILIFTLKSFKLGVLALIPNMFPLLVGAGIYALSGQDVDMASVLIASVCLGIAVDDSIHFLFEYKKWESLGLPIKENFSIIFTNTVPALINTTVILSLGFGAFIFADYLPNAKFGSMVSIILLIALLADIFILPAILMLMEKKKL